MSVVEGCHDVTVVGGGIGGAYAVWRLRQHGFTVGLYEFSNRLGGRFYTQRFQCAPDIPIELGAMRFSEKNHPILHHIVKEVGLKTKVYLGQDFLSDEALFFVRGKYVRNKDFDQNAVPYDLRPNEKKGFKEIYRYLTQKTNFSGDMSLLKKELHFLVSEDGVRLTDQSIQEFYRKYLSDEAVEMLSNILQFSTYNQSAALALHFIPSDGSLSSNDMLTISEGMQQLPEQLVKRFLSASMNHSLHMNHQLVSISRKGKDMYSLGFIKTRTVDGKTSPTNQNITICSRRVIIAVPASAIQQIKGEIFQSRRVLSNLNTVNYHFGVKLFLAYNYKWWTDHRFRLNTHWKRSNTHHGQQNCPTSTTQHYSFGRDKYERNIISPSLSSDLPLGMTIDLGTSNETDMAVLLVAYSGCDLWRYLQKHGHYKYSGYHSVSTEVMRHANLYLANLFDVPFTDIPPPIEGIISHWDAYPYGAPFCTSKIGVDWETVWKTIHKPSDIDDVFIASGPYSKRMSDSWSEHSLEAIKEIIDTYF